MSFYFLIRRKQMKIYECVGIKFQEAYSWVKNAFKKATKMSSYSLASSFPALTVDSFALQLPESCGCSLLVPLHLQCGPCFLSALYSEFVPCKLSSPPLTPFFHLLPVPFQRKCPFCVPLFEVSDILNMTLIRNLTAYWELLTMPPAPFNLFLKYSF